MTARYLSLVLICLAGVVGAEPKRDRFGDPLPEGAMARLGSLRLRHGGSVQVGDFSADGKLLSAFDGGNSIIFWDVASGREARRVPAGHLTQPRYFRLSPDGKSLILADSFGTFRILDAATGAVRLNLEPVKLEPRRYLDVHALAVSRDGKTAVTIYYPDILVVWNLAAGKRLRQSTFRNNLNRSANRPIALTPDGKHLVAPYTNGSLHLLDVASGDEVLAFDMPSDKPRKDSPIVVLSPDGRYLAFGGSSTRASESPCHSIALCEVATGKRLRELSSKDAILEWLFTPDSRSLALADSEAIRLFDVSSGKETRTIRRPKGRGMVFSPDGRKVADSFGTCISLWDIETGRLLHSPVGHDWFIRKIQFFPDGKRLMSTTSGHVIVWDLTTNRPFAVLRSGRLLQWFSVTADGEAIQFQSWRLLDRQLKRARGKKKMLNERGLEDGEEKRPSGTENRTIYRWHLATDRKEQQTVFSIPAACDWFELSPDCRRVARVTLGAEPKVSLSDVKGDKPAVSAALPDNSRVLEVKFSPDGRRLLVLSWYRALRVLDSASGQKVRDLKPDAFGKYLASAPNFTPDGRCVLLRDGQLRIREVASGKDRLQITMPKDFHNTSSLSVPVVSPNGRFLACNSYGGDGDRIHVFSTATGKLLVRWRASQGASQALAFSPDSRQLASGGFDGTLLLWQLPKDDELPAELSRDQAAAFWQELAADDAVRANRALAGLAAAPAQAVPLIQERFPTTWKNPEANQIARRIADLDDDAFEVRERATRELSLAGSDALPALRQALAKGPSPEAKTRLESILNRLNKGDRPKHLRELRAIEVLERIGSPRGRDVLRSLADKSLPAELREEVLASLHRLQGKP